MAEPSQPPLTSEERFAQQKRDQYNRLTRNASLAALILCPTLILLPPRKLDFYTFALGGTFIFSANHLSEVETGRSLWQRVARKVDALPTERARVVQAAMREREKEREEARVKEEGLLRKVWMGGEKEGWKERRIEEEQKAAEEGKGFQDMILEQVWEVWNQRKNDREEEGRDKESREKRP